MKTKQQEMEYKSSLVGKYVKGKTIDGEFLGRITSVIQDWANIKEYREDKKKTKPTIEILFWQVKVLTQKECIELGRKMESEHL